MPVLADLFLRDGQKSANLYMHYISQGLHITHLDIRDNLISHINAADSFAEVPLLTELLLDGKQLSHTVEDTAAPLQAPQAPGAPRPGRQLHQVRGQPGAAGWGRAVGARPPPTTGASPPDWTPSPPQPSSPGTSAITSPSRW